MGQILAMKGPVKFKKQSVFHSAGSMKLSKNRYSDFYRCSKLYVNPYELSK